MPRRRIRAPGSGGTSAPDARLLAFFTQRPLRHATKTSIGEKPCDPYGRSRPYLEFLAPGSIAQSGMFVDGLRGYPEGRRPVVVNVPAIQP
jgi:hypothetical protein